MPEISRFLGLLIKMQFRDHSPPHFHIWHGGRSVAVVGIRDLKVLNGKLSTSKLRAVVAWADHNRERLMQDWNLAVAGKMPLKIPPIRFK